MIGIPIVAGGEAVSMPVRPWLPMTILLSVMIVGNNYSTEED